MFEVYSMNKLHLDFSERTIPKQPDYLELHIFQLFPQYSHFKCQKCNHAYQKWDIEYHLLSITPYNYTKKTL